LGPQGRERFEFGSGLIKCRGEVLLEGFEDDGHQKAEVGEVGYG
jgi:hypothetical protein